MESLRMEIRGGAPALEATALAAARAAGLAVERCTVGRVYLLERDPGRPVAEALTRWVVDPVVEQVAWVTTAEAAAACPPGTLEVGRLPGVTDAEGRELAALVERLGGGPGEAASVVSYCFEPPPSPAALDALARDALANATVDRWAAGALPPAFDHETIDGRHVGTVPLAGLDGKGLAEVSRSRLLSLDTAEMATIQAFFAELGRDPRDAELETLAQTWSEHCLHKTFRASVQLTTRAADGTIIGVEHIDGLLRAHLRAATDAIDAPWVRSAFVDNAGIVAFDDETDLSIKVETHNHPSALEPFGGANTGVGGVVRDILGVSARPIACLDVLCFAPPSTAAEDVPEGVLHPRRVAEGVVAGIGDYGNKLGLPTVAGAVVYHPGYLGNPLVYCGAVGIQPAGSHPRQPHPGDLVVVLGGRTGRDGIHGATFSSADLSVGTGAIASSAVQIGDPITEKQVMELIEEARDEGLYTAVTDCGAGGLSSAVGELAAEVGVVVDLAVVPRKYPGLQPWEVWLSESQERMVVSIPPGAWPRLRELAIGRSVEATVIGELTGDERLVVRHGDTTVVDLPMDFLHGGCPRRSLVAEWQEPAATGAATPAESDPEGALLRLLADPTVASKESIVRTYDHEVRGGTLVRPWCGPGNDGPTDAAVCVPLGREEGGRAFALGVGINPRYGRLDPYRMALAAIDEAFRNVVCVGADPDRVALLDNFCWGNPTLADRLGGLVRASQGCYDGAMAYRAPFVSGKDSLFNEFEGRPIPGTLLITALGLVGDTTQVVTSAPSAPGQLVYVLGETLPEVGGSLWAEHRGFAGGTVPAPLHNPLDRYRAVHRAIGAGLVRAAHDASEGGLAVALAELAVAGRLGLEVEATSDGLDLADWLFAESNGRLLLVVDPADTPQFEALFEAAGQPLSRLGVVSAGDDVGLRLSLDGRPVIDVALDRLVSAWQGRP